jgi:hypothetical protein
MLRDCHERCATTTATTLTERVDLDCRRCAHVGVGPCRMARMVVKIIAAEAPLLRRRGLAGTSSKTSLVLEIVCRRRSGAEDERAGFLHQAIREAQTPHVQGSTLELLM